MAGNARLDCDCDSCLGVAEGGPLSAAKGIALGLGIAAGVYAAIGLMVLACS